MGLNFSSLAKAAGQMSEDLKKKQGSTPSAPTAAAPTTPTPAQQQQTLQNDIKAGKQQLMSNANNAAQANEEAQRNASATLAPSMPKPANVFTAPKVEGPAKLGPIETQKPEAPKPAAATTPNAASTKPAAAPASATQAPSGAAAKAPAAPQAQAVKPIPIQSSTEPEYDPRTATEENRQRPPQPDEVSQQSAAAKAAMMAEANRQNEAREVQASLGENIQPQQHVYGGTPQQPSVDDMVQIKKAEQPQFNVAPPIPQQPNTTPVAPNAPAVPQQASQPQQSNVFGDGNTQQPQPRHSVSAAQQPQQSAESAQPQPRRTVSAASQSQQSAPAKEQPQQSKEGGDSKKAHETPAPKEKQTNAGAPAQPTPKDEGNTPQQASQGQVAPTVSGDTRQNKSAQTASQQQQQPRSINGSTAATNAPQTSAASGQGSSPVAGAQPSTPKAGGDAAAIQKFQSGKNDAIGVTDRENGNLNTINAFRQSLGLKPVSSPASQKEKEDAKQAKYEGDAKVKAAIDEAKRKANKKTWRDYLFGSKTDEEWNKKRREKIAAIYDLVVNLGNLGTTAWAGAVPQKFESAYKKVKAEHDKDKKDKEAKAKADRDFAFKQNEADRDFQVNLGNLNIKQDANKREADKHPYEMAKAIAKASEAKTKAETEAATKADKIREAAGKAATAEEKANKAKSDADWADKLNAASLAQKKASANASNASAANSYASAATQKTRRAQIQQAIRNNGDLEFPTNDPDKNWRVPKRHQAVIKEKMRGVAKGKKWAQGLVDPVTGSLKKGVTDADLLSAAWEHYDDKDVQETFRRYSDKVVATKIKHTDPIRTTYK